MQEGFIGALAPRSLEGIWLLATEEEERKRVEQREVGSRGSWTRRARGVGGVVGRAVGECACQ